MWHNISFGINAGHRIKQKGRVAAMATAAAATLVLTSLAGAPPASAGLTETVIVTTNGLLDPVAAVLQVGGTVLQQFHLINGVEAIVPKILEPLLDALPGVSVTPDLPVSVQSAPSPPESTGPHTPSDAF